MEFRQIVLTDRDAFTACCASAECIGTESSFADMFCWRDTYHYKIAFEDGFVFIKGITEKDGEPFHFYNFPLGSGDTAAAIESIRVDALNEGHRFVIAAMDEKEKQLLEALYPSLFTCFEDRDNSDYVYLCSDLASLDGKKYHAKRNHIHRFTSMFPDYTVEQITPETAPMCVEMCKKWVVENLEYQRSAFDMEAVTQAMESFTALGLFGLILRLDGEIIAFSAGSARNSEVFITHFEKCYTEYEEAYAVINNEMAKALSEYTYINREEDMGLDGLRQSKLSYKPAFLFTKYYAVENF